MTIINLTREQVGGIWNFPKNEVIYGDILTIISVYIGENVHFMILIGEINGLSNDTDIEIKFPCLDLTQTQIDEIITIFNNYKNQQ